MTPRMKIRTAAACLALALSLGVHASGQEELRGLVVGEQPELLLDWFGGGLEQRRPHRIVQKGPRTAPLPRAPAEVPFTYSHEGALRAVDDYLARQRVTGLLVIHDGTIVLERYQFGRRPSTRFLSASMAKSVVGLLVGIALQEGRIRSIDDLAKTYVPALAGNPYGETSIRDLLQMASGIRFREQYDGQDDLGALIQDTIGQRSAGAAAALLPYRERRVAPGGLFHYSSADTQALALVLRGATGMPLAEYLATRIWQPMGAQHDASFLLDAAGQEAAFAFMHATLQDFGRLGMLLANDGRVDGKQVVPAAWVRHATTSLQPHVLPQIASPYFGYGYQFWTFPGSKRRFALLGVRGQSIFVDPELKLVLVQTAVWKSAGDRQARAELLALWRGIVEQYGAW
jgi:CubicO group peptidase (beta-lactamase class C family)